MVKTLTFALRSSVGIGVEMLELRASKHAYQAR
jgi:hypothetical protein